MPKLSSEQQAHLMTIDAAKPNCRAVPVLRRKTAEESESSAEKIARLVSIY